MNPMDKPFSSKQGFTLVELLVSMAILAILLALIAAVLQGAANSTSQTEGHVNADAEAGLVFNRMARDLAAMPKRNDVDALFYKSLTPSATAAQNDSMFFFTENPSPALGVASSNVSLIGYQVVTSTQVAAGGTLAGLGLPAYSLVRRVQGLALNSPISTGGSPPPSLPFFTYSNPTNFNNSSTSITSLSFAPTAGSTIAGIWTGALGVPLSSPPPPSPSYPVTTTATDTNYHLLGEGVFRLEICYLLKQQTYPATGAAATPPSIPGGGSPPLPMYSNVPTYTTQIATYPGATAPTYTPQAGAPTSTVNAPAQSRYFDTTNERAYVCQANWDKTHSPTGSAQSIWTPAGVRDVSAIIVGLAIIDPVGRARMTTTQLGTLASNLSDSDSVNTTTIPSATTATSDVDLMAYQWNKDLIGAINAAGLNPSMAPNPTFARYIHIYQHVFYLNSSNVPYETIP